MNRTRQDHTRAKPYAWIVGLAVLILWMQSEPVSSQGTGTSRASNDFISSTMDNTNGDIGFSTFNGDPLNPNDNSQQLVTMANTGVATTTSFATLRILDDFRGMALSTTFRDMQIRHSGTGADGPNLGGGTMVTSTETFTLVGSPSALGANALVATFQTQPTSGGGGMNPTTTAAGWLVRRTVTLARHQFEIRFEVTNRDASPRRAGLRMLLDTRPGGAPGTATDDGDPYFIPGSGLISTEREFTAQANNMPVHFFTMDNIDNPRVLAQGILRGSEATIPDKFQIVSRGLVTGNAFLFDYMIDPTRFITSDSGYTVTWNPVVFRGGETRTFVTYYGLGFASGEFRRPFVLATRAPSSLNFLRGPDPLNPSPNQLGHHSPSEFTITGNVFNLSQIALSNVSMSINLPTGLELVAGEPRTKVIATAVPNLDSTVTWRVRALGINAGDLTYSVTANVPGVGTKDVVRMIAVPALPQDIPTTGDTQMVSFPFRFANTSPDQILFDELTGTVLNPIRLATYDPRTNEYLLFPTDLTSIELGRGYWLRTPVATQLRLGSSTNPPEPIPTTSPFVIQLRAGWNMIGNPFVLPVFLGQLQVLSNGQLFDFADAGSRQIIRPVLFTFARGQGNVTADYISFVQAMDQITPRVGFWIFALQDTQLVFPPPQFISSTLLSRLRRQERPPGNADNDWRMRITAASGDRFDFATIGTSPGSSDQYDSEDIGRPPGFDNKITVQLNRPQWGVNSGRYARDIRSPFAGSKSWDIEVQTNLQSPETVNVTWPEIVRQSRRLRFVITDLDTNSVIPMRINQSYSFQAPAGPSLRRFRVTVEVGGAGGALRLTNIRAAASAGSDVNISFTATKTARLNCVVRNAAGKVVGMVANNESIRAGLNSVRWSGRNLQGLTLPRGVYLIEMAAQSEDGDRQTAVKTIRLR